MEGQILHIGLAFFLGYGLGTLDNIAKMLKRPSSKMSANYDEEKMTSFVSTVAKEQKSNLRRKVEIDDSKYVTEIATNDLRSGAQPLGVVSQSIDDISSAKNKLAQLKKLKG